MQLCLAMFYIRYEDSGTLEIVISKELNNNIKQLIKRFFSYKSLIIVLVNYFMMRYIQNKTIKNNYFKYILAMFHLLFLSYVNISLLLLHVGFVYKQNIFVNKYIEYFE